ncbi:MAG: hypothetical protein QW728_04980, partial [Thermoplasmata archaeon]
MSSSNLLNPDTKNKKRSVLVSLHKNNSEMLQLMDALGFEAEHVFVQQRILPHPRSFIGSGKLDEIKQYIESLPEGQKPVAV